MTDDEPSRRYRTIWISDVHLGTHDCKAADLLDFLTRPRRGTDATAVAVLRVTESGRRLTRGTRGIPLTAAPFRA